MPFTSDTAGQYARPGRARKALAERYQPMNITAHPELIARLDLCAERNFTNRTQIVRQALIEYILKDEERVWYDKQRTSVRTLFNDEEPTA